MTEPTLVVTYDNEVLGSAEFWRGPASRAGEIRNLPARRLAERVAVDGVTRHDGMWTVEVVDDE